MTTERIYKVLDSDVSKKPKLRVGKAAPKAANSTSTSFKAKCKLNLKSHVETDYLRNRSNCFKAAGTFRECPNTRGAMCASLGFT